MNSADRVRGVSAEFIIAVNTLNTSGWSPARFKNDKSKDAEVTDWRVWMKELISITIINLKVVELMARRLSSCITKKSTSFGFPLMPIKRGQGLMGIRGNPKDGHLFCIQTTQNSADSVRWALYCSKHAENVRIKQRRLADRSACFWWKNCLA